MYFEVKWSCQGKCRNLDAIWPESVYLYERVDRALAWTLPHKFVLSSFSVHAKDVPLVRVLDALEGLFRSQIFPILVTLVVTKTNVCSCEVFSSPSSHMEYVFF